MNYVLVSIGTIPDYIKKTINSILTVDKDAKIFFCSDQKIQLKDGQVFEPKKIIFTGTSQYLMNKKNLNHNSVKTIYFNTDSKPYRGKYIHIFPQEEYINNIAFLTSISTQYTKNKDHLLSVSVINSDISKHKLIDKVKRRLQNLYGVLYHQINNENQLQIFLFVYQTLEVNY